MLRPVLPTSIRINFYLQQKIPSIRAYPVQVHQVIMNICINARDAMNNRGHIDIGLNIRDHHDQTCTSCHEIISGQYLELSIQDSGPGINERIIERVFEPFFTTKQFGKGTGMGLAMVHGIIHNHNGHVIIDSRPGKGTCFRVLFPLEANYATETRLVDEHKKEEVI